MPTVTLVYISASSVRSIAYIETASFGSLAGCNFIIQVHLINLERKMYYSFCTLRAGLKMYILKIMRPSIIKYSKNSFILGIKLSVRIQPVKPAITQISAEIDEVNGIVYL